MTEIGKRETSRVWVVDDDAAVRDAIRLHFQSEGISARFLGDAEQLLQLIDDEGAPQCIVADVRLPGLSGLELQGELTRRGVRTPIILITGHGQIEMAVRAVKAGALDFLEKPFDPSRLVEAVRTGFALASNEQETQRDLEDLRSRVAQLSDRQLEVMNYAVQGFSNKEIALKMGVSPRTIESYRAIVMEKTGASKLAELVRIAVQLEVSK